VANLIRNAAHTGTLRLFIAPNSVKVLSKRSAKSLSSINDDRYYRTTPRLNDEEDYSSEPTEPFPRKKKILL